MRNAYYSCLAIILLASTSCGQQTTRQIQGDIGVESALIVVDSAAIRANLSKFTQFLVDKNGNITDSFPHATSFIKYLNVGKKQDFPYGFAALQQPLNDSIHTVCEVESTLCDQYHWDEDTSYCKHKAPFIEQLRPTQGKSYFDRIDLTDYYFFLVEVDSFFLHMEDTEYGFLHFMKLKNREDQLAATEKVVEEEYVNICEVEKITWKQPVTTYLFEQDKFLTTTFDTWSEVWECGEKFDYAPKFPVVEFKPAKGVFKSYANHDSPLNRIQDPYFVFAFLPLNKNKNEMVKAKARWYDNVYVQVMNGGARKGMGIDMDGDLRCDVFWYNRVYNNNSPIQHRNTVLYIKQHNNWIPVYINNCSDFY